MRLNTSIDRIAPLIPDSINFRTVAGEELAIHVIDGILDNEDGNGPGTYGTWTPEWAIESYVPAATAEGVPLEEIDEDESALVIQAVTAALEILRAEAAEPA
ncbi:hypothetical protein [Microvirga massiliensis]|uniref:hypothetical protein n=1 Tax=Microvirga massiliensis TaxID=1033741 RepID=UPI00062B9035|nr:hypothetical protein [Microvirga massiliensis]